MLFSLATPAFSADHNLLAKPSASVATTTQLASSPPIFLTKDFVSPAAVAHLRSKIPSDEGAYEPCIGQVDEFASKRCTFLPAAGDEVVEAVLASVERAWGVDTARLRERGVPIIRYLPGAPPVGVHGDEDRHRFVPNATLVLYLTPPDADAPGGGQTFFPDAGVHVTPSPGAVLSFENWDAAAAAPHAKAKHGVSAVPKTAAHDRFVAQIPIALPPNGSRPYAYAEHVSGNKKPGEHESMHGTDAQKGAAAAALAAGMSIAVAFMAAKAGKFSAEMEEELTAAAQATQKFSEADFVKKPKEGASFEAAD